VVFAIVRYTGRNHFTVFYTDDGSFLLFHFAFARVVTAAGKKSLGLSRHRRLICLHVGILHGFTSCKPTVLCAAPRRVVEAGELLYRAGREVLTQRASGDMGLGPERVNSIVQQRASFYLGTYGVSRSFGEGAQNIYIRMASEPEKTSWFPGLLCTFM